MIAFNDGKVTISGGPADYTSELFGLMMGVYEMLLEDVHDETLAVGLMTNVVKRTIEFEKIPIRVVLDAIRSMEVFDGSVS